MIRVRAGCLSACLALTSPAFAQTDFTDLTPAERAVFQAEIRAALLAVPQLLPDAPPVVIQDPYAAHVESDLARIAAHTEQLFKDGARLALFVAPDCADCARAKAELQDISKDYGVTFTQIDAELYPDLVRGLGLNQMPAYVFADRMFQGWMPLPVLERYLAE